MTSTDLAVLQSNILDSYYADNAKKLHKVVDRILSKFGGLSNKDTDDFYSLANEVFAEIMTEITRRNREKRKADRMSVSLDGTNDNEEECSLLDIIPSDFDTFEEVAKRQERSRYCDKVQRYISRLSNRQVNILNLLVDGYKANEIQIILEISSTEFWEDLKIMRSYENVKILF